MERRVSHIAQGNNKNACVCMPDSKTPHYQYQNGPHQSETIYRTKEISILFMICL
jgi:hypothetical protein